MWVFDNEIASILGTFENGDIVNIHDFDGYFMGYGYINTNSKITLRLLARRKDTVIDEAFLSRGCGMHGITARRPLIPPAAV